MESVFFKCSSCQHEYLIEPEVISLARWRLHEVSKIMPLPQKLWIEEVHEIRTYILQKKIVTCITCYFKEQGEDKETMLRTLVSCPFSWKQLTLKAYSKILAEKDEKWQVLYFHLKVEHPLLETYEAEYKESRNFERKTSSTIPLALRKKKKPKEKIAFPESSWKEEWNMCLCEVPSPTLVCTVKKEGKNQGREFLGCPNYPETCDFFQWIPENCTHLQDYTYRKSYTSAYFKSKRRMNVKSSSRRNTKTNTIPVCKTTSQITTAYQSLASIFFR